MDSRQKLSGMTVFSNLNGVLVSSMEPKSLKESTQLIQKITQGDETAFSAFYDKHHDLVYRLAVYTIHSHTDAEEVVQEVFMQVWRTAEDYAPNKGNPEAWITVMTRSRSIDKLRKLRSLNRATEEATAHEEQKQKNSGGEENSPLPKIVLESALSQLKEDHQKALNLSYFKGLTHEEIAKELSVPLGTAKGWLRDGLRELQKKMKSKGFN